MEGIEQIRVRMLQVFVDERAGTERERREIQMLTHVGRELLDLGKVTLMLLLGLPGQLRAPVASEVEPSLPVLVELGLQRAPGVLPPFGALPLVSEIRPDPAQDAGPVRGTG